METRTYENRLAEFSLVSMQATNDHPVPACSVTLSPSSAVALV
eukprot:COSAG02_NODE_22959_length_734_cov_1.253543_1_plen_42_part_10